MKSVHDRIMPLLLKGYRLAAKMYLEAGAYKTFDAFERTVWRIIRALYEQEINVFGFVDEMVSVIDNQYRKAWREGAGNVGVLPHEIGEDDWGALEARIKQEHEHILGLAEAIEDARLRGAGADRMHHRAPLWANRYNELVTLAELHFGSKERLIWRLGPSEENCPTCSALNGIVAFAHEWRTSGFRTQAAPNRMLACEGWNCHCKLTPTGQRRTPNAFKILMDMAVKRFV